MINPTIATTTIFVVPLIVVAIALFVLERKKHSSKTTKRYMYFAIGLICISLFYIFYPDPTVSESLYISHGDYTVPLVFAAVGAVFLFLSVYIFKKHMEP